jgi:hypothetical protein
MTGAFWPVYCKLLPVVIAEFKAQEERFGIVRRPQNEKAFFSELW